MHTEFPDDKNATAFLRRNWAKALSNSTGPVVDIACGFGRNARFLARRGIQIYCLDNDRDALAAIANLAFEDANLIPMKIDLAEEILPFSKRQLGGALCIHSWRYSWCNNSIRILAPLTFWSGTELFEGAGRSWYFSTNDGNQQISFDRYSTGYIWAVRDGDVATVPLPGSLWFIAPALAGLAVRRRRIA